MSIKARLIITISVLVAIAFAVIGLVTVGVIRDRMLARVDETLVAATASPSRHAFDRRNEELFGFSKRATATMVFDPRGNLRFAEPSGFADDPDPLPDVQPADLAARSREIFTAEAAGDSDHRFRVLIMPVDNGPFDGWYLVTAAPLGDVTETVRNLTVVIFLTGLVVLAGTIVSVWAIVRRGLQPIDDMITTAGLIATGDLSRRVEHEDATTEVGQLGQALNAMLTRIEASFAAKESSEQRLRQFVADASHELRTPLTSIRGYAELFRSGAASDPESLGRVMARIESEGTRMGKLVEDLLLLARLDQGRPLRREPLDLVQVVEDAVMAARVAEPDRPISFEHPRQAYVLGDADRLRQVLDNLLANVRVHTDPGISVHARIETTETEALLSVADEGQGIAPEDAPHVFDRFYRVDTSRSRDKGGTGLGLAIVASIIEAHDGRVTLETAPGEGTTFTIALKRASRVEQQPERRLDTPIHAQ